MARIATTNSGRFDDINATRSPARTPRRSSVAAMPLVSASSSDRVYCRSPKARTGGLSHVSALPAGHPSYDCG